MSDDKKYYYLKLKDNYFEQDNIKVLESLPNGHLYSLIILKLYLKACKYNGHLKMTDSIPYDPKKINILANVIGHDKDNVQEAIKYGIEFGLITILESGEMWMTEIQNYIGHSSSEADRKREYRLRLGQMSGQMSDKNPPEKEIKINKETNKEIKKDIASTEYFQLTEIFWNDLKALVNPSRYNINKPNLEKWSQHIRLLHERNGIQYKDMRDIWRWAMEHNFWKAQILSTANFREHFDKLKIQMTNKQPEKEYPYKKL